MWFIKQLWQWSIIAAFACAPFLFDDFHLVVILFSFIVIFGLIAYGLFDPASAIRRTLVSLASATFAISLTPNFLIAVDAISPHLLEHPNILAFIRIISSITQDAPLIPMISILAILLIAYVAQLYFENKLPIHSRASVIISLASPTATMSFNKRTNKLGVYGHINITNRSGGDIYISGLALDIIFSRGLRLEAYPASDVDEITAKHHLLIVNGEMITLKFVIRECPVFLSRFIYFLRLSYLLIILDVPMRISLLGSDELGSKEIALRGVF